MPDSKPVLIESLNKDDIENSIRRAIIKYHDSFGVYPYRVWVRKDDVPESLEQVDNIRIERRGGCAHGKIMVF